MIAMTMYSSGRMSMVSVLAVRSERARSCDPDDDERDSDS
jgi:hypothetical protein